MYYCKKCGKALPDTARFCDRCNTSVRQQSRKKALIDDLKEERLARQKAKEVEQRLRNIKKLKHRRIKLVIGAVILLILLGVGSGVASNIIFSNSSPFKNGLDAVPDITEEPTGTEMARSGGGLNSDGYIETEISGKRFAYPPSFTAADGASAGALILTDSVGDAKLTAEYAATAQTDPGEAMKGCIDTNGLIAPSGSVSDNTYAVTGTRGESTYHRGGRIEDGRELYYELVYPTASVYAEKYKEYAAYIDKFLKGV